MPKLRRAKSVPDAKKSKAGSDSEVRARYLGFLNRSVQAICPEAQWQAMPVPRGDDCPFTATVMPASLRIPQNEGGPLFLRATQGFRYVDDANLNQRRVRTMEYAYALTDDESWKISLFNWEWNPRQTSWPDPHAHIQRGDPTAAGFSKHHIPTGRVAFEHVCLYMLRHYDLRLPHTDDVAEEILRASLATWNDFKSW